MSSDNNHNEKAHDQAFIRTFGMVLAALGGIFAFCIFAAGMIVPQTPPGPDAAAKLEARLKPVGQVITDPAALVKVSVSAVKREPLTADQVYAQVCTACHAAGVLNAPKVGDKADWSKRLAANGGLDGLAASAIKGKAQMPARGGNPELSDDEIKASVKLILEKTGV